MSTMQKQLDYLKERNEGLEKELNQRPKRKLCFSDGKEIACTFPFSNYLLCVFRKMDNNRKRESKSQSFTFFQTHLNILHM